MKILNKIRNKICYFLCDEIHTKLFEEMKKWSDKNKDLNKREVELELKEKIFDKKLKRFEQDQLNYINWK